MDLEARRRTVRSLRSQGFDQTRSYKSGVVKPGCSQCQALVIQGVACHETGCPRVRKRR